MLFALGMFVFDTTTTLPDRLGRQRDWSHERTPRFLARAASQFTGPGEDRIRLDGTLVPELLGDYGAIETLARMADEGEAYPLLDGSHNNLGMFTIDAIDEDKDNLLDNGAAARNAFTITLSRVG